MSNSPDSAHFLLEPASLDTLLTGVIQDNREKVAGWMADQPGCWGFLAGKAVNACRVQLGRPLAGQERRLVWHELWLLLERVKASPL